MWKVTKSAAKTTQNTKRTKHKKIIIIIIIIIIIMYVNRRCNLRRQKRDLKKKPRRF